MKCNSKIQRTLCGSRGEARINPEENDLALNSLFVNDSYLEEEEVMVENWTLKELATHDLNQQPSCIIFSTSDIVITFEFKYGLIHVFPHFSRQRSLPTYKRVSCGIHKYGTQENYWRAN